MIANLNTMARNHVEGFGLRRDLERDQPRNAVKESPRKAAEAVSERTATMVEQVSAAAGGSGQPETIPATSGWMTGANVSGLTRAGVTGGERPANNPDAWRKSLRPNCLNVDHCGGSGRDHYWTCKKVALAAGSEAA